MPPSTLTSVSFAELAAGDEIVAIDGHELPATRTVEGTRRAEDGAVKLVHPWGNNHDVEWLNVVHAYRRGSWPRLSVTRPYVPRAAARFVGTDATWWNR